MAIDNHAARLFAADSMPHRQLRIVADYRVRANHDCVNMGP
jgi:hypothetical protein